LKKPEHIKSGIWAEDKACQYLQSNNCTVLFRNWRHKRSEIDIVIKTKRGAAFVEVKYRKSSFFGEAELAVTPLKIKKMQEAAEAFMIEYPKFEEIRFDIITVTGEKEQAAILYYKDAFFPDNLGRY